MKLAPTKISLYTVSAQYTHSTMGVSGSYSSEACAHNAITASRASIPTTHTPPTTTTEPIEPRDVFGGLGGLKRPFSSSVVTAALLSR